MYKRLLTLMLALLLVCGAVPSLADNRYLIPDSHKRPLTKEELWEWSYDALGYALNEIFARHGFPFDPEGSYDWWFSQQAWYKKVDKVDKQKSYDRLSRLEWDNENLIKEVRQEMRDLGIRNEGGRPMLEPVPELLDIPNLFEEEALLPNQKLPVYTGPDTAYLRGANNKAMCSTNDSVYVAGVEDGWVLILYRLNKGGARMGYTSLANLRDRHFHPPLLRMAKTKATIKSDCTLTDDPIMQTSKLAKLKAGDQVSYLLTLVNSRSWAYIETGNMRGCVPLDCLEIIP